MTGFYPYPFLEVGHLGYERVLLNMGVLMAAFAVLGLILVGIDRLLGADRTARGELTRVNSLGICWSQIGLADSAMPNCRGRGKRREKSLSRCTIRTIEGEKPCPCPSHR